METGFAFLQLRSTKLSEYSVRLPKKKTRAAEEQREGGGWGGGRKTLCCIFKSLIFLPASHWCSSLREQIEFACLDYSLTWPLLHSTNFNPKCIQTCSVLIVLCRRFNIPPCHWLAARPLPLSLSLPCYDLNLLFQSPQISHLCFQCVPALIIYSV